MKKLRRLCSVFLFTLLIGGAYILIIEPTAYPVASATSRSFDCSTASGLSEIECHALIAFYNATDGGHWTHNTDWLISNTPCSWLGVTCYSERVDGINLQYNNLSGALPTELSALSALRALTLNGNKLTALPSGLSSMVALQWLSLDDNQISSVPSSIGNLTALEALGLGGNQISSLPSEIGSLPALKQLRLNNNLLDDLPASFAGLTSLKEILLEGNHFTTLPVELQSYPLLTALSVGSDIDVLPMEIGNLTSLTWLRLTGNRLITLPLEIGNLTSLQSLHLDGNSLTTLPAEIGNLTNLAWLSADNNQLNSLPSAIGQLTRTQTLRLQHNRLTSLPSSIGNMADLVSFSVYDNPLNGELPSYLATLTSLNKFTFYDTGYCVPDTGPVLEWLSGVPTVYGPGLVCGHPGNSLSGSVNTPESAPAPDIQVTLYRIILNGGWRYLAAAKTETNGTYHFDDLGQGIGIEYRVHFLDTTNEYPAEFYDNQTSYPWSTPITLTVDVPRIAINATLGSPQPPTVAVDTASGSVTVDPQDGTVLINIPRGRASDITITRTVTCTSGDPTAVALTLTPPGTSYPMIAADANQFWATIPEADILQDGQLSVAATCGGSITETVVGELNLYDPSGTVTDAGTGQPVEGAKVTLYQVPGWLPKTSSDDTRPETCESNLSKDPAASWSQPAPTDLGVVVNTQMTVVEPAISLQVTDAAGYYGWDVGQGCWYVQVEASGYISLTSPVVGVPPEVTDLDLVLVSSISKHDIFLPLVIRSTDLMGAIY